MLNDTTPGIRPDTVTISADEYADLVRAAAQLDTILLLMRNKKEGPDCLVRFYADERKIPSPVKE